MEQMLKISTESSVPPAVVRASGRAPRCRAETSLSPAVPARRTALRRGLAAAACLAVTVAAWPVQAQAPYPNRPVKLIVPYAAGGLPDTVARIVGQRLEERLGQAFVVDNRPGANGGVAAAALATTPADGYTFMVTDGSILSINPHLQPKLSYSPDKDFAPVALLARAPLFLALHPKVPVGTLKEFIDYVKARPGEINYGSSGIGSTHHLSMEALKASLQLDMKHVPYRGTGQSVPGLLGGHVEVLFSAYPSLSGFIADKRLTLIATNGAERSAQAPDVPAIAEIIPGFDFAPIVGILARTGTPPEIIRKIAAEAVAVVKMPEAVRQLGVAGIEPVGGGPEDYARAIKDENDRVTKVVQSAGIKAE
jgi:tripartite-type tricarboxylate transporter receptor subunit TctC